MASKCGVKHKCGGASENDRNAASNNVASGANVVAVRNVASNHVASKCGVRHSLCQTVFQEMCLQKHKVLYSLHSQSFSDLMVDHFLTMILDDSG